MYLDTPPYSKYYWNQVTNETRWDHPSEYSTTQPSAAEREAQVRAQVLATAKAERVAKVLPMRITINRKPYMPPKPEVVLDVALKSLHVGDVVIDAQACESCVAKEAKTASVFCQACDLYLCDGCCDAMHLHPKRANHCDADFRFAVCVGYMGFPYNRHKKN
ncbi:hypothetical protein AaE_004922 [Aphanomyces astaci]|uniref:WW domain-containing protein n=1 Tax=Aphanomyces astaci TaxID=112090 RepID=A0A6A5AHT6_APHAT|nr:hypothetical protein AaE_004922 [Aphanomyces astaci]